MRGDWDWVTPQLATGGWSDDLEAVVEDGITHVINCARTPVAAVESGRPDGLAYLHNPTDDDGEEKTLEWFGPTLDFAVPAMAAGGRVLVHCFGGLNRGPSSAYAVLLALGHEPRDAETLIRSARPEVFLDYRADAERAVAAWRGGRTSEA